MYKKYYERILAAWKGLIVHFSIADLYIFKLYNMRVW